MTSACTWLTSGSFGSFSFLGSRGGVKGAAWEGEGVYDATSVVRRNWPPFASAAGPEVEAAVAAAQSRGKEDGRDPESPSQSRSSGNSQGRLLATVL